MREQPSQCGPDADVLAALRAGDRRALSKAITLVESQRADHRERAQRLLDAALPFTGGAVRLGITGVPGAGKSSLIESLGLLLLARGHRVAVLAIDPSSSQSGGSILGDKTRMEQLSRAPECFIRPSPSGGALGGDAARTRAAMLLCEAAGFDVVIVETVGVGQSETAVAGMTDTFLLMQLPHAGDDLQAIKKGVVELADLVFFNKADLDKTAVRGAMRQMENAMRLLRPTTPSWRPPVLCGSAARADGMEQLWDGVLAHRACLEKDGQLQQKRQRQALEWMWAAIDSGLRERFLGRDAVRRTLQRVMDAVASGAVSPEAAAVDVLEVVEQLNG